MNKSYCYVNGKAIVFDADGESTIQDYNNNLDKILIQENIIETINEKIKIAENSINKKIKNYYFPIYFIALVLCGIITPPFVLFLLTGANPYSFYVSTILGEINEVLLMTVGISAVLTVPLATILTFFDYSNWKDNLNKNNAINSELEFLKNKLIEEKQKLVSLKKQSVESKEKEDFKTVKVNDIEELKQLKNMLLLYYDLGYNSKKYYDYQQQGKLRKKLSKKYSEEDIKLIEQYLEKKGPTLVKRY